MKENNYKQLKKNLLGFLKKHLTAKFHLKPFSVMHLK